MGATKRALEAREADYEWARDLLCETGALEECENHEGTFYEGDGDYESASELAIKRIKDGEYEISAGQTDQDVSDLIQSVYQDNAGLDGCPQCDRNMRD